MCTFPLAWYHTNKKNDHDKSYTFREMRYKDAKSPTWKNHVWRFSLLLINCHIQSSWKQYILWNSGTWDVNVMRVVTHCTSLEFRVLPSSTHGTQRFIVVITKACQRPLFRTSILILQNSLLHYQCHHIFIFLNIIHS